MQVVEQQNSKSGKTRSMLASFASRTSSNQKNHHPQSQMNADFGHNAQAMYGNSTNFDHQYRTTQNYYPASGNDNHQNTKELIRQCFLFTNHLLLCTRTKDGKLHLLEVSIAQHCLKGVRQIANNNNNNDNINNNS